MSRFPRQARLLGVVGLLISWFWGLDSMARDNKFPVAGPPSIHISMMRPERPKRGITLDDMLSLREVHEPRQSPDQLHIAFLVKEAFRQCDCYRTAVYVTQSHGSAPAQKLAEDEYITNLQWTPDGKSVSYLSSRGGSVQLWTLNITTRRADRVFVHAPNRDRSTEQVALQSLYRPASGVLDYQWSPDGGRIAFTTEPPADPVYAATAVKNGFSYDDSKMSAWDLVAGDWATGHRSKQLWFYDVREKRERAVWTSPAEWSSNITAILWASTGKKLAFFYSTDIGVGSDSIGIVDAATLGVSLLGPAGGSVSSSGVTWSPDERTIAYLARIIPSSSYALLAEDVIARSRTELTRDIYPGHFPWLTWDGERHRIQFLSEGMGRDRRPTGIYSVSDVGGTPLRLTELARKIDECDTVLRATVACVWQSPSEAPRPALISLDDGTVRGLTDVNPEIASVELAPVRELHWSNAFGSETNGFLMLPTHVPTDKRVPIVVIGYSFSGDFVTQANTVLTTYPAQAFARDGIAVLLFNYPRYQEWKGASFELGSQAIGYGPLSSIQAILKQLDVEGVIDPKRVGMMGHSLAGFWVQLAITQTNIFQVVEMHNGGTFSEPGTYWEGGSKQFRELQEHIMGGPPYGATLKNYLGYSMSLNASRIHVPVLMEYGAIEAISAMEYYEAMQYYKVPVDFFIYPNDGHIIERPEHRIQSMQRNLDWFEFWLLGKENDASLNAEQYSRWRKFKVDREHNIVMDGSPASNLTEIN